MPSERSADRKRDYQRARSRALVELARRHPDEYQKLVEDELGRTLQDWGRPLTKRMNDRVEEDSG